MQLCFAQDVLNSLQNRNGAPVGYCTPTWNEF